MHANPVQARLARPHARIHANPMQARLARPHGGRVRLELPNNEGAGTSGSLSLGGPSGVLPGLWTGGGGGGGSGEDEGGGAVVEKTEKLETE